MTLPERPARPSDRSVRSGDAPVDHELSLARALSAVVERATGIAAWQEAGQARAPITDCLRRLASDDGQPISVALIGLTPEAVSTLLAWLMDHDHHLCKVIIPEQVGVAELLLQDRGFVVEGPKGRQEFEDVAAFLQALQGSDLVQAANPGSWMDPLRMHLAAPAKRRGLRLLVPNGLPALVRKAAHVSLLADRAALVLVAGAAGDRIATDAAAALAPIFTGGAPWIPVITEGDQAGWIRDLPSESSLPGITLGRDGAALDDLLFADGSPLRKFLRLAQRRRGIGEALDLLRQDLEQAGTSLANRRRLQDDPGAAAATDGRSALDGLRRQVSGDLASLRRDREQVGKVALRADGEAWKGARAIAQGLTLDDLERTANGADWELTLRPDTQVALQQAIESLARRLMTEDLDLLRDGVQACAEQAAGELARLISVQQPLAVRQIDPQALWETLLTTARPELTYKGTIPRMTVGSRFASARKPMMALSMVAFMFGGVATLIGGGGASSTLRTVLYASMLPLFIIGFIWTYVSGARHETDLLKKEAERMHDGLLEACKRAIAEFQREKQTALAQHLTDTEKDLLRDAEERFRAVDENRRRQREQDAQKMRERNRNLETREKETQRNLEEIRRLGERDLRDSDRVLSDWSRDIRRAPRGV